jgi:hypothetical protein
MMILLEMKVRDKKVKEMQQRKSL